jgi:hypothetical protein
VRPTDLSLTVSPSKLACVVDPMLALGYPHGPTVALRLARVFETWLTRSFWQVIDASDLLPGLLGDACLETSRARMPLDPTALSTWIAMRETTDAASWCLRWIGDCVAESQMRDGHASDVLERYELFSAAMGGSGRSPGTFAATWTDGFDPLMCACDALALSATLEGAPVLSVVDGSGTDLPLPVRALARANVSAIALDPLPPGSLFAAERELVRDALATVGLACIATTLPPLAVVHVLAGASAEAEVDGAEGARLQPWARALGWWYLV